MTDSATPWISATFSVEPDHPAPTGHFPGNPIVPGVMLLQRVLNLLKQQEPARSMSRLTPVKFLAPLRPRETCSITSRRCGAVCRFECRAGPVVIARGDIAWNSPD